MRERKYPKCCDARLRAFFVLFGSQNCGHALDIRQRGVETLIRIHPCNPAWPWGRVIGQRPKTFKQWLAFSLPIQFISVCITVWSENVVLCPVCMWVPVGHWLSLSWRNNPCQYLAFFFPAVCKPLLGRSFSGSLTFVRRLNNARVLLLDPFPSTRLSIFASINQIKSTKSGACGVVDLSQRANHGTPRRPQWSGRQPRGHQKWSLSPAWVCWD